MHPDTEITSPKANCLTGSPAGITANRRSSDPGFLAPLAAFANRRRTAIVVAVFGCFLLLGLGVYRQYGISWDEPDHKAYGDKVFDFLFHGNKQLLNEYMRYYGPVSELPMMLATHALGLQDTQKIYYVRHLVTFLMFFAGVLALYGICQLRFGKWWLSLTGALFLILSPRIFAESFYNAKDIPFLSLFTISIFTMLLFLKRKSVPTGLLHALACALLIDTRIPGIVVPLFTAVGFGLELVSGKLRSVPPVRLTLSLGAYVLPLLMLVVIFWPTLWSHPLDSFLAAFKQMKQYPLDIPVLFRGKYVQSTQLPWDYTFVWIAVTTPPLILFLFVVGFLSTLAALVRRPLNFISKRSTDILISLWLIFPLAAVIALHSVLYDGWRHNYFVYPAILLFSAIGLEFLIGSIRSHVTESRRTFALTTLAAVVIVHFVITAVVMAGLHPFENVYFNTFAGSMRNARKHFEMDYWGLSYRKALEQILAQDKSESIPLYVVNRPGFSNAMILPAAERNRLVYVDDPARAKYFISNYRWHPDDYPYPNEFFSVKVNGVKLAVVYRL